MIFLNNPLLKNQIRKKNLDPQSRLQARIDEQSELICILKKRADSLILDTKQYQTRIEKIESVNSSLKNQLNTEKTKVRMLESRFVTSFKFNLFI